MNATEKIEFVKKLHAETKRIKQESPLKAIQYFFSNNGEGLSFAECKKFVLDKLS